MALAEVGDILGLYNLKRQDNGKCVWPAFESHRQRNQHVSERVLWFRQCAEKYHMQLDLISLSLVKSATIQILFILVSVFCKMSGEGALHASVLMIIAIKAVIIMVVCYKMGQRGGHTVIVATGLMQYPKHIVPDYMEREMPIRLSSKELRNVTNNFTNLLSAGGCGPVYKGISRSGQSVAVKIINGRSDKRMVEQFMEELDTLGRIRHPNLVQLYGFCFERDVRALVYEYTVIGSLDRFLTDENMTIGFMKLHEIAVETAKGIAYLHEEYQLRIIHYDIKPENILLDARLIPKIANFGSVKLCNKDSIHKMPGGSWIPEYVAPELWMPFPVTRKIDVYSFGMALFEIIKRKKVDINLPETQEWFPNWVWNKFEKGELADILTICRIEEKDREMAERMVKVALWCVQYAPESRPSMNLVVKMLDGRMNIPTPANPFPHIDTVTPSNLINVTS